MNLFGHIGAFGDATAVIADDGERLSYRELAERADEAGRSAGTTRTLVAVECDNSIGSLCAYVGAMRCGHAVLMIDASLPEASKEALVRRYRIAAIWRAASASWEELSSSQAMPQLHPDLALLLSTSGTTGSPKLVRLSGANLRANAEAIGSYLGLGPEERPITSLPMHYTYGLSVVHSHFLVGATLLLTSQPISSRAFWDFFRAESATSFSGVPAMYEILQRMRFATMSLPSLRNMTQAGGRLSPDAVRYFAGLAQSREQGFWVMYGQAEATARMAYLPPDCALDKPESIGQPIPGGRFGLLSEAGEPIFDPDTIGELLYFGPNVMMGYAEQPEDLARGDELHGRLATGDLARCDKDGFYTIAGRIKRFIKVFGNRISLDEVETFARASGLQAAATGKDDLLLLAVIEPSRPLGEIRTELSRQYRLHHSAVRVIDVPSFPMSGAGKIQYPRLLSDLTSTVHRS